MKSFITLAVLILSLDFASAQTLNDDKVLITEACNEAFTYDFQRIECRLIAHSSDQVKGCSNFKYDFQKFECIEDAHAVLGGVNECYFAFNFDFQRFDCLRLTVSATKVQYCTKNNSLEFEIFECLQ
jgi:hypothetical protein